MPLCGGHLMTVNGELNFYLLLYSSFPSRLHVWLVLQNGVRSPEEEVGLNEKETCHSATSVSVKRLGRCSEIRFFAHTPLVILTFIDMLVSSPCLDCKGCCPISIL